MTWQSNGTQQTMFGRALLDATASNSGGTMASCILIERRLLLRLACHHHVHEHILSSVHKELTGATSGPDNTNSVWSRDSVRRNIKQEKGFNTLQISNCLLQHKRDADVVSQANLLITLPRDDYRECTELMFLLLGETPPRV